MVDHLCQPCAQAFQAVKDGLAAEAIPFTLNPELVRGLDYYTRTVFEYQHESLGGAQNALGGGGRYDGLAAALGYRVTPGVGFAIGLDRTAMVLKKRKPLAPPALEPSPESTAFLAALGLDPGDLAGALQEVDSRDPRVAVLLEPMLGVTLTPTMISAT